jgi:hypothetical protein
MKTGVNISFRIPIWLDRICAWPAVVYRLWKYGYTYRRIYLGQDEWTIVDEEDYYRYGNIKWCLGGNERKLYATGGIKNEKGGARRVYLHREIMNPPKGLLVDHRNREPLDNRRSNLRFATHAENSCNRRKAKTKTSTRFIGLYLEKQTKIWVVRIRDKGRSIFLGRFKSEAEAARAYDRAAIKYHGEFASLNFPRENYINEVRV